MMEMEALRQAWSESRERDPVALELIDNVARTETRRSLLPLQFGQLFQILGGLVIAGLGAPFWLSHLGNPQWVVSGLVLHAYGVVLIVLAIRLLLMTRRLDYSKPVVEIQTQLLSLEKAYIQHGFVVGLPWWVLWIPLSIVLLDWGGISWQAPLSQTWSIVSLAFGLLGMLATVGGYIWARNNEDNRAASQFMTLVRGEALSDVRRKLEEMKRFEQERSR